MLSVSFNRLVWLVQLVNVSRTFIWSPTCGMFDLASFSGDLWPAHADTDMGQQRVDSLTPVRLFGYICFSAMACGRHCAHRRDKIHKLEDHSFIPGRGFQIISIWITHELNTIPTPVATTRKWRGSTKWYSTQACAHRSGSGV